jgi:hypothetical protein
MCPAGPPDVVAYPCAPLHYVARMTLGPWALMGHVIVWTVWWALLGMTWILITAARAGSSRAGRPTNHWRLE